MQKKNGTLASSILRMTLKSLIFYLFIFLISLTINQGSDQKYSFLKISAIRKRAFYEMNYNGKGISIRD